MSKADSNDGASTDPMAATVDSGSLPAPNAESDTETPTEQRVDGQGDELIGVTLNERYLVTAKIGQGGMGAVYEAKHTVIGKRVAIKVLLDKHADKEQIVARLKQEARLASSIGHDNIVDITDFGITDSGRTFVVMEYLEGESLGACIAENGRLDEDRTIDICLQIASALSAAHKKDSVHRDIKPENIFLVRREDRDFVKVVDFGISKSMVTEDEDVRLTQTGMVLGTPLYMSPEQAKGDDDLDQRIDIYALGVILYESLTGEVPFQGKNYLNILTQVIADEPKDPSLLFPQISRDLESVILKAMAKERDQRYQDMDEFAADLSALRESDASTTGARITAARWRKQRDRRPKRNYALWVGGLIAIGASSTLAAVFLTESESKAPKPTLAALPPLPRDAAPPPPDAKPAERYKTATIRLESKPAGAAFFRGGERVCVAAPCPYQPVITHSQHQLRVELEGYISTEITITPEVDDGTTRTVELDEIKTTSPKRRRRPIITKPTKDAPKTDNSAKGTADEVMSNPHRRPAE